MIDIMVYHTRSRGPPLPADSLLTGVDIAPTENSGSTPHPVADPSVLLPASVDITPTENTHSTPHPVGYPPISVPTSGDSTSPVMLDSIVFVISQLTKTVDQLATKVNQLSTTVSQSNLKMDQINQHVDILVITDEQRDVSLQDLRKNIETIQLLSKKKIESSAKMLEQMFKT